ncbi:DinB family protein, partial [Chloroflexota bacterium]
MEIKSVFMKSLDESQEYLTKALEGLSEEDITWSPNEGNNSIIFILWHVTRVEDIWLNRVLLNRKEIYESEGWQEQLGTPIKESGYQYDVEKLRSWPIHHKHNFIDSTSEGMYNVIMSRKVKPKAVNVAITKSDEVKPKSINVVIARPDEVKPKVVNVAITKSDEVKPKSINV